MADPNKNETRKVSNLPQALVRELGDLAVVDLRDARAVTVGAEAANSATKAVEIATGFDTNRFSRQQGPAGYEAATWSDGDGNHVSAGARDGVVEHLTVTLPPSDQAAA